MWFSAAVAVSSQSQAAPLPVDLPGEGGTVRAMLYRPPGDGPFPAVIAAHGCGGLSGAPGVVQSRYRDWAEFLNRAGYAVLLPDSYGSRELGPQCTIRERRLRASRERVADVVAAQQWLARQSWAIKDRISLMGWSSGGSGVLWTVRPQGRRNVEPDFRAAVVFYPDCRRALRTGWSTRLPTLLLIGADDDWASVKDCQQMIAAAKGRSALARIVVYPGAYQDFDRDDLALQVQAGMSTSLDGSGRVHIGSDKAARDDARKRVMDWLAR